MQHSARAPSKRAKDFRPGQYLRVGRISSAASARKTLSLDGTHLGTGWPFDYFQRQLKKLRAEQRIALHRGVQLALGHRLERVADAVNGDDLDVHARLEAVLLDGLDRAQSHVVVVREHGANPRAVPRRKSSMTSFPLARVKSPESDPMISMPG